MIIIVVVVIIISSAILTLLTHTIRGVLVRLTDSAREKLFDGEGNPRQLGRLEVIENGETGSIKVGELVFEFDIVRETGRCEIVEVEYVIYYYYYYPHHL